MFVGQLGGGADPDDFFRDRIDEPDPLLLQVLLLRHLPGREGAQASTGGDEPQDQGPYEQPADDDSPRGVAVARAHRLAAAHEVRLTEYASGRTDPLHALADLVALTDFAAVYLGLAAAAG